MKVSFWVTLATFKRSVAPHGVWLCTGWSRKQTFLSLQKVPLNNAAQEGRSRRDQSALGLELEKLRMISHCGHWQWCPWTVTKEEKENSGILADSPAFINISEEWTFISIHVHLCAGFFFFFFFLTIQLNPSLRDCLSVCFNPASQLCKSWLNSVS